MFQSRILEDTWGLQSLPLQTNFRLNSHDEDGDNDYDDENNCQACY